MIENLDFCPQILIFCICPETSSRISAKGWIRAQRNPLKRNNSWDILKCSKNSIKGSSSRKRNLKDKRSWVNEFLPECCLGFNHCYKISVSIRIQLKLLAIMPLDVPYSKIQIINFCINLPSSFSHFFKRIA